MNTDPLEIADDTAQQLEGLAILNALHRAGESSVWLDSVMMFTGGLSEGQRVNEQIQHHHVRVVIDETDIPPVRYARIAEIAEEHGARLALAQLRMNGQDFSRLSIWPAN